MKKYLFLLIFFITSSSFASDFSNWVSGYADELMSLGEVVQGCTGSTTTAFRDEEEIRKCSGIQFSLPDSNLDSSLSIDQLSKYAWIENKFQLFSSQLQDSYRETYELYQYANHGISKNENTEDKFVDIDHHFRNLFYGRSAEKDFETAIRELKCDDPRSGNWTERNEICKQLKDQNKEELLEYNRASAYSKYPFLSDPVIQSAIERGVFPDKRSLDSKIKQAINNQFERIKQKQREVIEIINSPTIIAKYAKATPGPRSNLTGEEWATLSYLINGVEEDLSQSESKFIHAKCLFEENLLNHQKLMGWSSFKNNVFITAVSLGAGGAAIRIAKAASLGGRTVTAAASLSALVTSAVGVAVVDYPEVSELAQSCKVQKDLLNTIQKDAGDYLVQEKKVMSCDRELSAALLLAAISPIADIISTASVAGRMYFSGELTEQASKSQAKVLAHRQQATVESNPRANPVTPSPARLPTDRELRDQFFSRSSAVQEATQSAEEFARAYNISPELARSVLDHRRQAFFHIDQTINHRNSAQVGTLTRDSLTSNGRRKYESIEEYHRAVDFPPFNSPPMTVSELISRVTYNLGGQYSKAGKNFMTLSKAMDNFSEMKRWHQDLYDSAIDFLMRSNREDWIESFSRTGKIPREVTEQVLLERGKLYGWGGEFSDISGGIVPRRDFGAHIASGNYIRELDLDRVVKEKAEQGGSLNPEQARGVLSGEIIHGDLTHAAHMDYMLYLSSRGRLGDIRPKELKEIIASYGNGLINGTPGARNAWGALFDLDASGTTMRTPNVFYSVFGRDLNL